MPIKLKIARTAQELDDVFKLRYDVYVSERNKFSDKRAASDGRIVDHFDAGLDVANVVAYEGDIAIAAFRVNKDSAIGLAPEKYFDFSQEREKIAKLYEGLPTAQIVSCSMLAIRKKWRNQRNVIFALFKKVTAVMHGWGATHVIGAASAETFSLYGRLGVEAVAKEQWVECVGDSLIPVMGSVDKVFSWAFGADKSAQTPFWLDNYGAEFETLLLSPGEVLFCENDEAECAYVIEAGGINISRQGARQEALVLAQLGKAEFFEESAILGGGRRSVTATATRNTQVIVLKRDQMLELIQNDRGKWNLLLQHFSQRISQADHLSMVAQLVPQEACSVSYSLGKLWGAEELKATPSVLRFLNASMEQAVKQDQLIASELQEVRKTNRVAKGFGYDEMAQFFRNLPYKNTLRVDGGQLRMEGYSR